MLRGSYLYVGIYAGFAVAARPRSSWAAGGALAGAVGIATNVTRPAVAAAQRADRGVTHRL